MELKKIKLTGIVNEKLTNKEFELLKGGILGNGCNYKICSSDSLLDSVTNYCTDGDGVCSSFLSS